jgi:hypothetical protein
MKKTPYNATAASFTFSALLLLGLRSVADDNALFPFAMDERQMMMACHGKSFLEFISSLMWLEPHVNGFIWKHISLFGNY